MNNTSQDPEYKEYISNREKKLQPKLGKFWCWGCDAQIVREWEKCPNCGLKNTMGRFKRYKR